MAFRRNEAESELFDRAVSYLTPAGLDDVEKQDLINFLEDLTIRYGSAILRYPTWHPLVVHHNPMRTVIYPGEDCGYYGLDHTVCFANAFISCPYSEEKRQAIIESANNLYTKEGALSYAHLANIEARAIDKTLYSRDAYPVLVSCEWNETPLHDRTIPKKNAIGLMLESEVPCWRNSDFGEPWEKVRPYLFGEPCGKRSSLFLDQEAGKEMKKVYEIIVNTGMYGPIRA